jgi:hypothetical protein
VWKKNTQGADLNGNDLVNATIASQQFNATGQNFQFRAGDAIQF